MPTYSLRPNVAVEPGIDGWYAWSYLVSPHTAALLRANHYRTIVQSFLTRPDAHAKALRDPKLQGGPFVIGEGDRFDVIEAWWQHESQHGVLDELADALKTLEQEILPQFDGGSLADAYQQLPEMLRGLVELFYERDNVTATYRVIEPLLYAAVDSAQREHVRFSFITQDKRPFALTTPLLDFEPDQLSVRVPLSSPLLDRIFSGGLTEADLAAIEEALAVPEDRREQFRGYFAEDAPRTPQSASTATRVQYAGHACVLVEHAGSALIVDPVLSYSGYENEADYRLTFDSLPDRIDAVLISHNHQDHMLLETLLRIRHKVAEVIVPESTNSTVLDPSLPMILEHLGFRVTGLREFQERQVGPLTVTPLPFIGEHGDLRIQTKTCFLVRAGDRAIVFAADATNINPGLYDRVAALAGPVDIVFIGMECVGAPVSWLYGPLFASPLPRTLDRTRRLRGSNFEQAKGIVEALGAAEVYVYAMGQEPWLGAVMCVDYDETHPAMVESGRLVEHVRSHGGTSARLFRYAEIVAPA